MPVDFWRNAKQSQKQKRATLPIFELDSYDRRHVSRRGSRFHPDVPRSATSTKCCFILPILHGRRAKSHVSTPQVDCAVRTPCRNIERSGKSSSMTKHKQDWDPSSADVLRDLVAAYDEMRRRCPVAHSELLGWSLFRHEDVTKVLADPERACQKFCVRDEGWWQEKGRAVTPVQSLDSRNPIRANNSAPKCCGHPVVAAYA